MCDYGIGKDKKRFTSDLAAERRRADISVDGISYSKERCGPFEWERICVSSEEGEESIGRPKGFYDTLNLPKIELMDEEEIMDAANEVSRELCELCTKNNILPGRILVVGLGNKDLTPDSVGPKSAEITEATMQLKSLDSDMFYGLECSEIAVFAPGVSAKNGFDTALAVKSLCHAIAPDVVIAIDSLASSSSARLGRTIQISDTGIFPGSGLGFSGKPLNKDYLSTPVLAIGVPTVINSERFIPDDQILPKERGMFVSPKEIDGIVKNAARIIAGGINQAFGIFS